MAVTVLYDPKNYDTTKLIPAPGQPYSAPTGLDGNTFKVTITTAALADATSGAYLTAIPSGKQPYLIIFSCDDLDSGANLQAKLVERYTDSAGNNTDADLFTTSGAFQAAQTNVVVMITDGHRVGRGRNGHGHLIFTVTTAAGTPAQGVLQGIVLWHG